MLDSIRALGLDPNGRFEAMHDALCKPDGTDVGYIPPSDPNWVIALEAERDLQLLGFVFDQLVLPAADSKFCKKAKHLLNDAVLPDLRKEVPSTGRDAQFELFIYALCHSAGLESVDLEEPDITCQFESSCLAIAAKRIKSEQAFVKRAREGAIQIKRTGNIGIVALDISFAINPNNKKWIMQIDEPDIGRFYEDELRAFVDRYYQDLCSAFEGTGALGAIIHDYAIVTDVVSEWALHGKTYGVSTSTDRVKSTLFDRFFDQYKVGLPDLTVL